MPNSIALTENPSKWKLDEVKIILSKIPQSEITLNDNRDKQNGANWKLR